MSAEFARKLVAYNRWASDKIFIAAEGLSDDELQRPFGGSYETLGGTLVHILHAQKIWLARWTRGSMEPEVPVGVERIRAAFDESQAGLEDFVGKLSDDDWDRVFDYHDSKGAPHSLPLGLLISHLINHGTYHRGESALMLTAMERSPGDLDLVYFLLGQ